MKIIIIAAISNLGKIGDVLEVKNGYAKNFLIPNKKAICFTANNYKVFESKKHEFEQEHQKSLDAAGKFRENVVGKDIIIIENASDDGRLYGSVSSSVIASKINDIVGEKHISRGDIFLSKPIKEIGIYTIEVSPHSDITFQVKLIVTRSESEIASLLKTEQKKKEKAKESAAADAAMKVEKPKKEKSDVEVSDIESTAEAA